MGRSKKYQPEQVVNLSRQIEVAVANGKMIAQASKEADTRRTSVGIRNMNAIRSRENVVRAISTIYAFEAVF